jgi:hypothetical protein
MTDDLTRLLRDYRDEPCDDSVKEQARARLLEAASHARSRRQPKRQRPRRGHGGLWGWHLVLPAAATCAAVIVAVVTVGRPLPGGGTDRYELVRISAPVFPVTPTFLPAGLATARFSLDEQGIVASYPAAAAPAAPATLPTASVFIRVSPDRAPAGADDEARPVTVTAGVTGQLWNRPGDRFAALVYERNGTWIKIGGQSALADPAVLLRIARELSSVPQRVGVSVSLAPQGWKLQSFKDSTVSYDDPDSTDVTRSLTVTLYAHYDSRRVTDGSVPATRADVGHQRGSTAVRDRTRYLTFPLPDGRGVLLAAPADLPLRDLVRIAQAAHVPAGRS